MVDELCFLLEKRAVSSDVMGSAMELGGLGLLASMHIQRGRFGKYVQGFRGGRLVDLAGLGLLGLPSGIEIFRSLKPRRRKKL